MELASPQICRLILPTILTKPTVILADKAYDADWIRDLITAQGQPPTSQTDRTARITIVSLRCSTRSATSSSVSSIKSNSSEEWRHATKSLAQTFSPWPNSPQPESGCGQLSPRPRRPVPWVMRAYQLNRSVWLRLFERDSAAVPSPWNRVDRAVVNKYVRRGFAHYQFVIPNPPVL